MKKMFNLVFDFCLPNQKCIKVKRVTLKNNEVVERHGTQRRLHRVFIPYKLFSMIKLLVINVSSLNFTTVKHLLFYIPYKIYKHSLISIDYITPVYELFDNPSYL